HVINPATIFPKGKPDYTPEPVQFESGGAGDHGGSYEEREKFIARVSDGIVGTSNCEVLTPNHWLITEFLHNEDKLKPRYAETLARVSLPAIQHHAGRYATIYTRLIRTNYAHFLLDGLPRLLYLDEV